MSLFYNLSLTAHLVCGTVALTAFWVPLLARKGSAPHRRAGKVFLLAMLGVIVTGVPLCLRILFNGHWVSATFLLYIFVITSTAVATAWFALRFKQEPARYFSSWYRALAWMNIVAGLAVLGLGLGFQIWLLVMFSLIGLLAGRGMLVELRATTHEPKWWMHEHLSGMIGGGIAAHVAFGAFGLRRIWPAYANVDGIIGMLPWLTPVVIGMFAIILFSRYYRRKFANLPRVPV